MIKPRRNRHVVSALRHEAVQRGAVVKLNGISASARMARTVGVLAVSDRQQLPGARPTPAAAQLWRRAGPLQGGAVNRAVPSARLFTSFRLN
jgi:hypothetical protein